MDEAGRVKKGDRFVAAEDFSTGVLTQWRAPFTGGSDAIVPRGTVLVAVDDQKEDRPGFACLPERYEEMEMLLVPEEDRTAEKYAGYYLVLESADIGTRLLPLSAES
jgi:hypothetical protein